MKNSIIRAALQALADAPKTAAAALLEKLPPADRADAVKLFQALGVKIDPSTIQEDGQKKE